MPYSIEMENEDSFRFLSVHFSYVAVNFNDNNWDIKNSVKTVPLQPVQELKDYYQIHAVFERLVNNWNAELPGYEFITQTMLRQLIIEILLNIKKSNQNYGVSLKVEKIIQYMHQNSNHQVTLTKLSELVQLSPAYLSKAFKDTTGYSVIEYFNKIKIDKAKELIIEGDKKIKEVARVLGFTDEFYFSRVFKKIEGISPSKFNSKNVHGF